MLRGFIGDTVLNFKNIHTRDNRKETNIFHLKVSEVCLHLLELASSEPRYQHLQFPITTKAIRLTL